MAEAQRRADAIVDEARRRADLMIVEAEASITSRRSEAELYLTKARAVLEIAQQRAEQAPTEIIDLREAGDLPDADDDLVGAVDDASESQLPGEMDRLLDEAVANAVARTLNESQGLLIGRI